MSRYFDIKTVLTMILYLGLMPCVSAQTNGETQTAFVNADSYETSLAALDALAQTAGRDKLIIMIARRGLRESSRNINHRRLQAARSYLQTNGEIPAQRIITAQGDPVRAHGRVEVYLDGRLFMVFTFARNRNFAPEP